MIHADVKEAISKLVGLTYKSGLTTEDGSTQFSI